MTAMGLAHGPQASNAACARWLYLLLGLMHSYECIYIVMLTGVIAVRYVGVLLCRPESGRTPASLPGQLHHCIMAASIEWPDTGFGLWDLPHPSRAYSELMCPGKPSIFERPWD